MFAPPVATWTELVGLTLAVYVVAVAAGVVLAVAIDAWMERARHE